MVGSIPLVVLGIAFASVSYAQEPARDERLPIRAAFADDQLQVFRVSLVPGASAQRSNHPDALLVSLTVDLDGRVPRDDAAWHAAGTTTLENRAKTRFDGILVDLAAPPLDVPAPLPPEVAADRISEYPSRYRSEDYRVRTVLDNPRVLVTWHRLPPWRPQREPRHFHPREVVLVYLAGGEIRGSTGRLGIRRVRRGDFDVLPANVLHTFHNAGNDPIEFLMITPK
jgi:quercetin dioxygenase-like cupin family protein